MIAKPSKSLKHFLHKCQWGENLVLLLTARMVLEAVNNTLMLLDNRENLILVLIKLPTGFFFTH